LKEQANRAEGGGKGEEEEVRGREVHLEVETHVWKKRTRGKEGGVSG